MSIELAVALGAIIVSMAGAIFNYYKLKDDQNTWEQEQKISIEKKLLFKRLKKRHKCYSNIFTLLGYIRDIEYPKEHHQDIKKNKKQLKKIADKILLELYGKSGLFMEYKTRSLILKTYQISYKYANNEATLEELIDSYYYSRRAIRDDLEFDDSSGNISKDNIFDATTKNAKELMVKKEQDKVWAKKNVLAMSARPGYPNKNVTLTTLNKVVKEWKELKIKSIICLLSDKEMQTYYKIIDGNLIQFYIDNGFEVFHISVDDFQTPPLNNNQLTLLNTEYLKMKQPLLVHCGAGEDRTGQAVEVLLNKK